MFSLYDVRVIWTDRVIVDFNDEVGEFELEEGGEVEEEGEGEEAVELIDWEGDWERFLGDSLGLNKLTTCWNACPTPLLL